MIKSCCSEKGFNWMIKGGAFDIGLNVVFNQGNGVLKMKKHEDECKNDAMNVTKVMLQKQ